MTDNPFRAPDASDLSDDIPVAYLRECFSYNPADGRFFWRDRPARHFETLRGFRIWEALCRGKETFLATTKQGYRAAGFKYYGVEVGVLAHRVAWALQTDRWPEQQIDHIDRNRANNVFANLRAADQRLNSHNRPYDNATGVRGVHRHGRGYRAAIKGPEGRILLGSYASAEEAGAAYRVAASRLYERPFEE